MIQLSIRKQFPDFVRPPRKRSAIAEAAGPGESEYTQYDRRVADIAAQWLRDVAGFQKPWVLFVSFVTPHYPLVAPKEFFDLYPVEQMPDPARRRQQDERRNHRLRRRPSRRLYQFRIARWEQKLSQTSDESSGPTSLAENQAIFPKEAINREATQHVTASSPRSPSPSPRRAHANVPPAFERLGLIMICSIAPGVRQALCRWGASQAR